MHWHFLLLDLLAESSRGAFSYHIRFAGKLTLFLLLCSLWKFVVPFKTTGGYLYAQVTAFTLFPFLYSMSGALLTSLIYSKEKINEVTFASLYLSFLLNVYDTFYLINYD